MSFETNTTNKGSKVGPYTHKSREEFTNWTGRLRAYLTLHKDKLQTILDKNQLHHTVKRAVKKELKAEKGSEPDDAELAAREEETLQDMNELVYSIIVINIEHKTLLDKILRDYEGKGHEAYNYIASKWAVKDNHTRLTTIQARRKEHEEDGIDRADLDAVTLFVEKLTEFNKQLKGSSYHYNDTVMVTTILDALAQHEPSFVRSFRSNNKDKLDKLAETQDALYDELEENDRIESQSAARIQKKALRAQVQQGPPQAQQDDRVAALEEQIKALRAQVGGGRPVRKVCKECGGTHGGECIGKRVATGAMTREEAISEVATYMTFREQPREKHINVVDAAVSRYKTFQGTKKDGGTPNGVPAGQPPPRKHLAAMVKVHCNVSRDDDAPTMDKDGFEALRQDSGCDQHIFNCINFFPYGVNYDPKTVVQSANGSSTKAAGIGDAYVTTKGGEVICYKDALWVPTFPQSLASIEQSLKSGARVCFDKMAVIFPGGESVPIDKGFQGMSIRPPTDEDLTSHGYPSTATRSIGAMSVAHLQGSITRGRHGNPSGMHKADTAALWGARLNVSAERMRKIPDATVGAPVELRKATNEMLKDDHHLAANAPRLHPAPVGGMHTDHCGQITSSDIIGPLPPSKHGGFRYAAGFNDHHTDDGDVYFMRNKSEYPDKWQEYITQNEGRDGCKFEGGTFYADNENVINSRKTKNICSDNGITIENSCEYEPWQNGKAERSNRDDLQFTRAALDRGNAGDEYWPECFAQSRWIHKRVPSSRINTSPYERRTGHKPNISATRPLFCLAYARRPPALRTSKLRPQADRCLHLGFARNKPGYKLEVLEGPRKGTIIYSSQVIFREMVFPLRDDTGATATPSEDITFPGFDEEDDDEEESNIPTPADHDDPDQNHSGGSADDTDDEVVEEQDESQHVRRSARQRGQRLPQEIFATKQACLADVDVHMRSIAAYTTCVEGDAAPLPDPMSGEDAPKSFKGIAKRPDKDLWYEVHYKENDGLFQRGDKGLRAVPRQPDDVLLPLRTIYTVKSCGKKKARTVLGGHRMVKGRDFKETFSPTIKHATLRTCLAYAAANDMILTGGDVTQAFVQAEFPEDRPRLRATMPDGYENIIDGVEYVVELGNLYGGPEAGRIWYMDQDRRLKKYGFVQCEWDHCLYVLRDPDNNELFLLVYVDDLLMFHTSTSGGDRLRGQFAKWYTKNYEWTDFGIHFNDYLAIRIVQGPGFIAIDSEQYIDGLVKKFFPGGTHITYDIPTQSDVLKLVMSAANDKVVPDDKVMLERYQSLVMSLLYVSTTTAPDVAFAVSLLTRCMAYPTKLLMLRAERVLIYLNTRKSYKIKYHNGSNSTSPVGHWAPTAGKHFEGHSDASFDVSRSTSGYIFKFAGGPVAWAVKKQASTALSTQEAEIMAGSLAACEAVYLRGILDFLGEPQKDPTLILMDNSSAITLAKDPVNHSKSKHILRRELHIRELYQRGDVDIKYVKSAENLADVFTKHLDRVSFQKHRDNLMEI